MTKKVKEKTEKKDDAKKITKAETKKSSKLSKEIAKLKEENEKLKDQMLRKAAEFENFRNRTEREVGDIIRRASERLITNILPVMDDFERSFAIEEKKDKANKDQEKNFREGIQLIHGKLSKLLKDNGLKIIESDGKEFDPNKHEAMMQIDSDKVESNHIVQTFEKGFILGDKVIRHSKVTVSK